MKLKTVDYEKELNLIKSLFQQKLKKNPAYSMRSFAKELQVSPALLSLVFSGKRKPSAGLILLFQSRFGAKKISTGKTKIQKKQELKHYLSTEFVNIQAPLEISHWYEVAILDLLQLETFKPDVKWISEKLGISIKITLDTLEKLSELKLIETKNNKIKKNQRKVTLKTTYSIFSIRQIHREFIQKALLELDQTDEVSFSKRRISGTTMAINPKLLEEAKIKVDAFQQELTDFLTQGKCTELYQINLQLFSLLK